MAVDFGHTHDSTPERRGKIEVHNFFYNIFMISRSADDHETMISLTVSAFQLISLGDDRRVLQASLQFQTRFINPLIRFKMGLNWSSIIGFIWLGIIASLLEAVFQSWLIVGYILGGLGCLRLVILPMYIKPAKLLPIPALNFQPSPPSKVNTNNQERVCLVTGATGFTGKVMVNMLLEIMDGETAYSKKEDFVPYTKIRAAGGRRVPKYNRKEVYRYLYNI